MLLFAKGSVSGARSSAFYTFFFLALSCLSSGQRVAVAAHPHSGTACSSAAENNIPLLSYHVHVLFWPSNNDSTAAAMKLQADFIEAFGAWLSAWHLSTLVIVCSFVLFPVSFRFGSVPFGSVRCFPR
eukprot:INCI6805.2.p2 GENE.INCI6805.2~~INCI6805.2.p2  ORF type:complete len:128 (-),score=8.18 INCI6805.2:507-890(-)